MMQQRVLTYQEYADLGYTLYQDYRAPTGKGSTLKINHFDIAYRADTKEQYAADYVYGVFRVTTALATGGTSQGLKAGATYLFSLLS